MALKSKIEWTETTWNPVTGCTKISSGCKNCYAAIMAARLKAMGIKRYSNGFNVTLQTDLLDQPRSWRRPRQVFVNSMSDLFHDKVPEEFISRVFRTMNECPQHTFQVLTKRSARLREIAPRLNWTDNIWAGVSVEDSSVFGRILDLKQVPAKVRFLSLEPLLGPCDNIPLEGIGWAIVGGESGRGARPIQRDWVASIRDQCVAHGVAFFFKQWGGIRKKAAGRLLDGRTHDAMPVP